MRGALTLLSTALLIAQDKPDIKIDVDLVTVSCSATDRRGAPVEDLKAADFEIRDNGERREIRNFWQEADLPLTVALVADVSGSQAGFVRSHRDAVGQFLKQVIGPRDRAMVVEVASQAYLLSALTGSSDALDSAVTKIGGREWRELPMLGPPCRNVGISTSCGGTALWHALYYTAKELKPVTGRKAIVVLSDGMDTGSDVSLGDLIEMAQSADAVVYAIKYESPMRFTSISALIIQAASRGLERLSRETGGLTFPNPGRKTAEVFSRIESELRNMYVLGFTPPAEARDARFHKLEVKSSRRDVTLRARSGYWARADQTDKR